MAMADVIARLSVLLSLDTAAFEKGADASEKRLKKMEREFSKLGDRIGDIGKKFSLAITAPVLAAGAAVVKSAADFEQSMIKLSISSQATSGEMKEMSELALKLGKDTIFGASDAVNAMDELAKSGLSARDILDGAAEAAVALASATGSELSPAANAITDTMKQFGLTTAQLPDAVNQITGAVNQSKLDFADYALAIGQAGGVAGGLGVQFTDFNASLAATSSLFASGSDAGTSFKTFLTSLSGNSKEAKKAIDQFGLSFFNANGSLKSMAEIAEQLRTKLGGLNDEAKNEVLKKIFGTDAMRTAIGLMQQGADGLNQIAAAIAKTDAAAQSQERLKGFYGQLENLKGAVETLAIRIGQSGVLEAFTAIITKLGDFVDALSETSPGVLKFVVVSAGIAAAVGPAAIAIGALTSKMAPLFVAINTKIIPALIAFGWNIAAIATTAGPAAAGLQLLTVAFRGLLIATGVGAAIAAVTGLIYWLGSTSRDTARSVEELEGELAAAEARLADARKQAQDAGIKIETLRKSTDSAAGSFSSFTNIVWAGVDAMTSAAKAAKELTLAKIALSSAEARSDIAELGPKARYGAFAIRTLRAAGEKVDPKRVADLNETSARLNLAAATLRANAETKRLVEAMGSKFREPGQPSAQQSVKSDAPTSSDDRNGKKTGNKSGAKDRAEEELKQRLFRASQDELSGQIEVLRAQQSLAIEAGERGQLARDMLNLEAQARDNEITEALRRKEITKEQADAQRKILDQLYGKVEAFDEETGITVRATKSLYGLAAAREERLQIFQEENDLASARNRAEIDALRIQFDLADTDAERKRIALLILKAEDEYLRAKLQAVKDNADLSEAVRRQAEIELNALNATAGARRESVARANETQVERYMRDLNKTPAQINEAVDQIKINGLQNLNDQLVDALVNFKSLGDVAKTVLQGILSDLLRLAIQQAVIKPLASALGLGIPGFAGGTNFAPGGLALVGERGPELVNLPRGSQVIPNNELANMRGGSQIFQPTFVFPGVRTGADAREAGAQAARAFRQKINGPVRV